MAEPIDLPFGLWTLVGRRKHKFNRICQLVPPCPHGRAHWCNLANTSEPSVCFNWRCSLMSNYFDHYEARSDFTFVQSVEDWFDV